MSAQISVGLRAGAGINNLEADDGLFEEYDDEGIVSENKNYSSFVLGIPLEIGLTDNFAIQPELTITRKGDRQIVTAEPNLFVPNGFELSSEIVFTYIEIPILAKVKLGSDVGGVGIFAGPSFAYASKGESVIEYDGDPLFGFDPSGVEDLFEDDDSGISRSDVNAIIGISPYFNLGNLGLFFDARYLLGLSDLDEEDDDFTVKNRSLQLSAGVMFNLTN